MKWQNYQVCTKNVFRNDHMNYSKIPIIRPPMVLVESGHNSNEIRVLMIKACIKRDYAYPLMLFILQNELGELK